MVKTTLVRHWMGMSKEEITQGWTEDEQGRFEELIKAWQEHLEKTIVENIDMRAQKGDIDAVEWLVDRGLLIEDGWKGDWKGRLKAIAGRARAGELDAVEWLEKRELIELPSKTDATE